MGANGVGKSTLLSLIYHKLQKQSDLLLGYMPQDYSRFLDPESSPLEFLQIQQAGQAQTYLANLQFSRDEVHQAIKHLSGGQQAKALLAKMVLEETNFLILDESSRNFSPTSQPEVRQLFQQYPGGLICVSHNRRFLSQVCDKLYQVTPQGLEEIPFSFL
ncbi:ATP-binding cassette domain-containing protein [Streptococcus sp. NLN64]|uniref:ATP-binding cassette domain-containing protein n=1 Tax=Streptococcus sp. NLN64 TaxID=2822799 RepID=UPI0032B3AC88